MPGAAMPMVLARALLAGCILLTPQVVLGQGPRVCVPGLSSSSVDTCSSYLTAKLNSPAGNQISSETWACVSAESDAACVSAIKSGDAEFYIAGEFAVYRALVEGLRPYSFFDFSTASSSDKAVYYSVGAMEASKCDTIDNNSPNRDDFLNAMKDGGVYSCHTGYQKSAGWTLPLGFLINNGVKKSAPHRVGETSNVVHGDAETMEHFFGEGNSCVPGKSTSGPVLKSDGTTFYDVLCGLCPGSTCDVEGTDNYEGYEGAVKCMWEYSKGQGAVAEKNEQAGKPTVAWTKHTAILPGELTEIFGGASYPEPEPREIAVICPTKSQGSRCSRVTDWGSDNLPDEECRLGLAPAHAIIGLKREDVSSAGGNIDTESKYVDEAEELMTAMTGAGYSTDEYKGIILEAQCETGEVSGDECPGNNDYQTDFGLVPEGGEGVLGMEPWNPDDSNDGILNQYFTGSALTKFQNVAGLKPGPRICVPDNSVDRDACTKYVEDNIASDEYWSCVTASTATACVERITEGNAELFLAGEFGLYKAMKEGLYPYLYTEFDHAKKLNDDDKAVYYSVAVMHDDHCSALDSGAGSSPQELFNYISEQRVYSCHTGYQRSAGWYLPLGFMLEQNLVEVVGSHQIENGPGTVNADAETIEHFFGEPEDGGGICVPGKTSDGPVVTDGSTDYYAPLCSLCPDESCSPENNKYNGYEGAVKCMWEYSTGSGAVRSRNQEGGKPTIAWTKHTVVTDSAELDEISSDVTGDVTKDKLRLLCPGKTKGSRCVSVDEWNQEGCVLGLAPAHAIVALPSDDAFDKSPIVREEKFFENEIGELEGAYSTFISDAKDGNNLFHLVAEEGENVNRMVRYDPADQDNVMVAYMGRATYDRFEQVDNIDANSGSGSGDGGGSTSTGSFNMDVSVNEDTTKGEMATALSSSLSEACDGCDVIVTASGITLSTSTSRRALRQASEVVSAGDYSVDVEYTVSNGPALNTDATRNALRSFNSNSNVNVRALDGESLDSAAAMQVQILVVFSMLLVAVFAW